MALNTTQSAQLTATATTEGNATTTTTPVWDTETFGLGTSTAAEEGQEDDYDTNKYFKTYDGEWYSKKELVEAVWEKFKDVYNWKHMRGSTAQAISKDVLEIIDGLYSGDLTISGGLLYTVKGSKNYDSYSSWKSKYEGNKPHHANSKYDSDAKNNAAWVVMNAFRTLTDEDTKKKSLQESASTSSLAALKQDILNSILDVLNIYDPSDLSNWYDIDNLNETDLTRSVTNRLNRISEWLNDIWNEYSQKDLKKEYGLNDKQLNQFKHALIHAYEAIKDGTINAGDYNALDGLNRFLGMTLKWSDLLKTDFETIEEKSAREEAERAEKEEKANKDYNNAVAAYIKNIDTALSNPPYDFKKITNLYNNVHVNNKNGPVDFSIPGDDDEKYKQYKEFQTKDLAILHFKYLTCVARNEKPENDPGYIATGMGNLLKYCIDNNILRKDSQSPNLYYFPQFSPNGGIWVVRIKGTQGIRPEYELDYVKFTEIPDLKTKLSEFYKLCPTWGNESLTEFKKFLEW